MRPTRATILAPDRPCAATIMLMDGDLRIHLTTRTRGRDAARLVRAAMRDALAAGTPPHARLAAVVMRVLTSGGTGAPSGFAVALAPQRDPLVRLRVDVRSGVVREE